MKPTGTKTCPGWQNGMCLIRFERSCCGSAPNSSIDDARFKPGGQRKPIQVSGLEASQLLCMARFQAALQLECLLPPLKPSKASSPTPTVGCAMSRAEVPPPSKLSSKMYRETSVHEKPTKRTQTLKAIEHPSKTKDTQKPWADGTSYLKGAT